jgi:hypothetical protein
MSQASGRAKQIDTPEYLADIFQPSDHIAILVRNRPRGETIQRIASAARIVERSFQQWLHDKNDREGFDIYAGMNPLKPGSRSRTKEDIATVRHVYLDIDHQGPAALAAVQQSSAVPTPNYVLSTSPNKFQVVWRVDGIDRDSAESLLRSMARKFGADPAVTDVTRVLRLPGFLNRKYSEETAVRAEKYSERVNQLLDFKLRADASESPLHSVRRGASKTNPHQARPLSQSERDWAYAKRALARGADPEEVIRSIAQFREGQKHNPIDYAQRTVRKARDDLRQQGINNSSAHSQPEGNHDY